MYNEAVQFLEITEKLDNAPEVLQTKIDVLKQLGSELEMLISDMKQQSRDILDGSSSNK